MALASTHELGINYRKVVLGTIAGSLLVILIILCSGGGPFTTRDSLLEVSNSDHKKLGTPYSSCELKIPAKYNYTQTKFDNPRASKITRARDFRMLQCIGHEIRTDKVVEHSYEYLYTKYLYHVRNDPPMPYGAGHSVEVWRRYLPKVSVSILEYQSACAKKFRANIEGGGGRLYIGSQSDPALLQSVVGDAKQHGLYDVIIDDGNHLPDYQLRTFKGLWAALKPGGMYVVEDTCLAYSKKFQDKEDTFLPYLTQRLVRMMNCRTPWRTGINHFSPESHEACASADELERQILSIECMWEACVVVKDAWA